MKKGQIWGAYRDGPILTVFNDDSTDSPENDAELVLLREDLFGPTTHDPRAEIKISLDHLRAAVIRQITKTDEQLRNDTNNWVVDTNIVSDEEEEDPQEPITPGDSQNSAYDAPISSRPTATSERPKRQPTV